MGEIGTNRNGRSRRKSVGLRVIVISNIRTIALLTGLLCVAGVTFFVADRDWWFSEYEGADQSGMQNIGAKRQSFLWKEAIATVFWVGEQPSPDNAEISNQASAWDPNWTEHFGGVDDPDNRCNYKPCSFKPMENPFYVALPYDDLDENRKRKRRRLPWKTSHSTQSVLKNKWVAVQMNERTCYGQWQDVGPFETDDYAYVFGAAAQPVNTRGEKAGIDVSPAIRDCLQMTGVAAVMWRLVHDYDVPPGPWKQLVTLRPGP